MGSISVSQALNLSAPETLWELLMEKEFLRSLILSEQAHCGAATSAQTSTDSTSDHGLTLVEENTGALHSWICYKETRKQVYTHA